MAKRKYEIDLGTKIVTVRLVDRSVSKDVLLQTDTGGEVKVGAVSKGYKRGQWFAHYHDKRTVTEESKELAVWAVVMQADSSGLV